MHVRLKDRARIWGMIFLFVALLVGFWLLFNHAFAQDFVDTNQITIEWDPVAPIDPADVMAYQVFRAPYPFTGDGQDEDTPWEDMGVTLSVQMTLTFTVEGDYVAGVRAVRDVQGIGPIIFSDLIWSDIDGVPNPFVLRYYMSPDSPVSMWYI